MLTVENQSTVGIPSNIGSPANTTQGVVLHYVGGTAVARGPHENCRAQVRGYHNFHKNTRGWSGIGYNACLCHHGILMLGRGLNKQGAHAPGANSTHFGLLIMVGGNQDATNAQLKGLRETFAWLSARGVNTSGITGHSDWNATSCPGNPIRGRIRSGDYVSGENDGPTSPESGNPGSNPSPSPSVPAGITSTRSYLRQQSGINNVRYIAGHATRVTQDNLWGPETASNVQWLQRMVKTDVDGKWGPATETAYQNYLRSPGWPRRFAALSVDGRRGPLTNRAFQTYLGVKSDGIIGPITVRAWQKKVGASQDGIAGRETWRKTQEALNQGVF